MQATTIPVIATGKVFDAYLTAARTNLENMLKLATALGDKEFARAAQHAINGFECGAETAFELIEEANENATDFDPSEAFWRESTYAIKAGLGQ